MEDVIARAQYMTEGPRGYPDEITAVDYQLLPPESERLDVLARVMEADVLLMDAGVMHSDIAPRNVMLGLADRIVLVDLNMALVHKYCVRWPPPLPKPYSPLRRYWKHGILPGNFSHWAPQSWLTDANKAREWLYSRWATSEAFAPIDLGWLELYGEHPLIQKLIAQKLGE